MRKGLTEVQAKRLVGATEEELEADADELLESFGGAKETDSKTGKPTRPREALRSGAVPGARRTRTRSSTTASDRQSAASRHPSPEVR